MTTSTNTTIKHGGELLDVRTANEWIRTAKRLPAPRRLFGDMWLEGELCVLFADTAKGKSLLAAQIAESIARGRNAFVPLPDDGIGAVDAESQTVLYFDFELSKKQFEMRYSSEKSKNHYRFSDRFKRVEINLNEPRAEGFRTFEEFLLAEIERTARSTKGRIVIIDNITFLKRSNDGTRDTIYLVKRLKGLIKEFGLSILAIAHTARRGHARPITANDLQGSKVLANFADNIFAIGQSRLDAATRYIKHIKPRSSAMRHDHDNVPVFRIARLNGNFLGFEYTGMSSEAEHLEAGTYTADREAIARIKELAEMGMSIRSIAIELGLSKSKVHRMLHLWPGTRTQKEEPAVPLREHHNGPDSEFPTVTPDGLDLSIRSDYFPGMEEYEYAFANTCSDDDFEDDDPDETTNAPNFLVGEGWIIEEARDRAQTAFRETGVAPSLNEDPEYRAFKEAVRMYEESGGAIVSEPIAHIVSRFAIENSNKAADAAKPNVERASEPPDAAYYIEPRHPS